MPEASAAWPTPLAERLAGEGPMPFRDYMAEALYTEGHGYYTQRDLRPGRGRPTSDTVYVTGIARQLARLFEGFARDHSPRLIEEGTGSVKLVRFLLASLSDDLRSELELFVVEPRLARRTRLVAAIQEFGVDGTVVGSASKVPPGPCFVVAKELLSTFPVHLVEGSDERLEEVYVRFADDRWAFEEELQVAPPSLSALLDEHGIDLAPGERYEVNPHMGTWLGEAASRMEPGVAVVLDRPRPRRAPSEGTIQALRDGAVVSPYEAPGELDLSAAVDTRLLASMASDHALEPQGPQGGLVEASGPFLEPTVLATGGL